MPTVLLSFDEMRDLAANYISVHGVSPLVQSESSSDTAGGGWM